MIFSPSLKRLVYRAKANPQDFARLYDLFFPKIYGFVYHRVGSREVAEDLNSEIWLKILKNLSDFHPTKDIQVTGWLFRIARNHITDYYRTHKPVLPPEALLNVPDTVHHTVIKQLDDEHDLSTITAALTHLSVTERDCISLKYISELSNTEISELLALKSKTVSSHLTRGLKKIRKLLNASTPI